MDSSAYYSRQEESFSLHILLGDGVDPDSIEKGDSIVTLPNGNRYSALMMTREEVSRVMDRHAISGESLGGNYFSTPDLIVIRDKGVTVMVDVIRDIVHSGEIALLLPRIVDDALEITSM